MFYLMTHSTHFILRIYGVGHMVKDHSDIERGNPLLPHGLLFPINSKGSFICTIPQDSTYHGLCYTSRGKYFLKLNKEKDKRNFLKYQICYTAFISGLFG